MDHSLDLHARKAEPGPDSHAGTTGAAPPIPGLQPDQLPPWLRPGAVPVSRWGRPLYAWGATLTATALMVAFGLWIGDEQQPLPQRLAATPSAPSVPMSAPVLVPAARGDGAVPALVLLPAAEAGTRTAPAVLSQPAPAKPPQGRVVPLVKKPVAAAKRRATLAAARAQPAPRAGVTAPRWNSQLTGLGGGVAPRMRCKRGELARECLARYR